MSSVLYNDCACENVARGKCICPHGSYCAKTVLLIECHSSRKEKKLQCPKGGNFTNKDHLSALEPSDPGPMYVRKCRVLPIGSASAKSKFNNVIVSEDILISYFHPPDLYSGTINSSCPRKSTAATCYSCSREGLNVSERERNTSLAVSGRERGFSTSVSAGEQGLSLGASGTRARFLIRCFRTRTSSLVSCGLCMETFTRLWRHALQDHRSPLPAICGMCAWLPRSCSVLFDE